VAQISWFAPSEDLRKHKFGVVADNASIGGAVKEPGHFEAGAPTGFFPGESIGGVRGQWLGGTIPSAEHDPITGVWGQSPWSGGQGGKSPPEVESILVIGYSTESANIAPFQKCPFELSLQVVLSK